MRKTKVYDLSLLLFRVGISLSMLTHGYQKLTHLLEGNSSFANPIGFGETFTLYLAILSEFVAPLFVIVGYKARFASVLPFITMIVAALIVHAGDPFAKQELALLYAAAFFIVFMIGPGKISLDRKLK